MLTWNNNYMMNIDRFDIAHKQCFDIATQIAKRITERGDEPAMRLFVVREGCKYLNSYFAQHVKEEEAYMRKIGYPDYAVHRSLHENYAKNTLASFQRISAKGVCTPKDVYEFIGTGLGWLLEHIANADMAIVGKGVLMQPKISHVNEATLEAGLDTLFAATLNIETHTKVLSSQYAGEDFGQAFYQKLTYRTDERTFTILAGIERTFAQEVAAMIYGDGLENEPELVISTLHQFGEGFWKTVAMRFEGSNKIIHTDENVFIRKTSLLEEMRQLNPTISVLFGTDKGRLFVASNSSNKVFQ